MKDEKWIACREKVFERDKRSCRLFKTLSVVEALTLKKNAGSQFNVIDPAHVLARSVAPWIKYEPLNVVCLNRYSHHMLEDCKHPITGENITKEEEAEWWRKIIGPILYEKLITWPH